MADVQYAIKILVTGLAAVSVLTACSSGGSNGPSGFGVMGDLGGSTSTDRDKVGGRNSSAAPPRALPSVVDFRNFHDAMKRDGYSSLSFTSAMDFSAEVCDMFESGASTYEVVEEGPTVGTGMDLDESLDAVAMAVLYVCPEYQDLAIERMGEEYY